MCACTQDGKRCEIENTQGKNHMTAETANIEF